MNTWWLFFSIIVILSSITVLWFFQMRRLLVRRTRLVIGLLEKVLKPRDQQYTLLGYLVGFKAVYKLSSPRVPQAWALYMLPPHHVLLYVPVILLGGRKERLELTFRLSRPPGGEAHIYDPRDRATRRSVRIDLSRYRGRLYERDIEINGRIYKALYSSEEALRRAHSVLSDLAGLADVKRVTIASRVSAFHVALVPRIGTLEETLNRVVSHAYRLAR